MLEKIFNDNLEDILKQLAATGNFEYNKDGLCIKASANGNSTSITCTYNSQAKQDDKIATLKKNFDEYITTLSDEFFTEICESYKVDNLDKINEYINSNEPAEVIMGIEDFMAKTKAVAKKKIAEIDEELIELNKVRNTYVDVLSKKF